MKPLPPLGPRALASHRRLVIEIAAMKSMLDYRKPGGTLTTPSVDAISSVTLRANKLFCRHAELPWFPRLDPATPLTQADFALQVGRLAGALRHFEEIHATQLDPWLAEEAGDGSEMPARRDDDGFPSPHLP